MTFLIWFLIVGAAVCLALVFDAIAAGDWRRLAVFGAVLLLLLGTLLFGTATPAG